MEDFIVEDIKVDFLLTVPITQKELEYKNQYGIEAFESLFDENEIDIFDLDRKSVV